MERFDWKAVIKQGLEEKDLNMKQASLKMGRGETYVRDVLKRDMVPSVVNFLDILKAIGVSPRDVFSGNNKIEQESVIPLVSQISAGTLSELDSTAYDGETFNFGDIDSDGDYIALIVDGTSMNRIACHGSIILVDRSRKVLKDKAFYVFQHDGEATFKRYRSNPIRLEPYSTDVYEVIYPDIEPIPIGEVRRIVLDL